MQKLFIAAGQNTPEINFSPEENLYIIRGTSSPEDVRALYYPVIDWFAKYSEEIRQNPSLFSDDKPFILKVDLSYFNSSSAKFIYDMITELKNINDAGIPVRVEWYYDREDIDMRDAGRDISGIVEMSFEYIGKEN